MSYAAAVIQDLSTPTPVPRQAGASPAAGARSPSYGASLAPALEAVAAQERVRQAVGGLREASARLRWHEALRRRWREARAEAAVRDAVASAALEGAVVPVSRLREAITSGELDRAGTGDAALDAAGGLWRAGVRLAGYLPDLRGQGRPAAPGGISLLTSTHRDVVGGLAAAGRLPLGEVGIPRRGGQEPREGGPGAAPGGEELAARLEGVVALIEEPGLPALVRCALVHAEIATARPFTAGNAATARALVRYLAARDGLEPTAVGVPDLYAARDPGRYARTLAGYASGTGEGVVGWVLWQAEALAAGVQEGLAVCRSVQAGTAAA